MREFKKTIREYLRTYYNDERLAQLLCHARDGKLAYASCCCLVGIPTADHALVSQLSIDADVWSHYTNLEHVHHNDPNHLINLAERGES